MLLLLQQLAAAFRHHCAPDGTICCCGIASDSGVYFFSLKHDSIKMYSLAIMSNVQPRFTYNPTRFSFGEVERNKNSRFLYKCTLFSCVRAIPHINCRYICCNWGNRSKAEANKSKTANLGQKRCELFPGILLTSKYVFPILLRTRTSFWVGSGLWAIKYHW